MVITIDRLTSGLSDNTELYEMSKEEGDIDGLQAIADDAAKLEGESQLRLAAGKDAEVLVFDLQA